MVAHAYDPSHLGKLILPVENHLNSGGRGCGELRSCHCTPAWATREKLCLKKEKKQAKKSLKGIRIPRNKYYTQPLPLSQCHLQGLPIRASAVTITTTPKHRHRETFIGRGRCREGCFSSRGHICCFYLLLVGSPGDPN